MSRIRLLGQVEFVMNLEDGRACGVGLLSEQGCEQIYVNVEELDIWGSLGGVAR